MLGGAFYLLGATKGLYTGILVYAWANSGAPACLGATTGLYTGILGLITGGAIGPGGLYPFGATNGGGVGTGFGMGLGLGAGFGAITGGLTTGGGNLPVRVVTFGFGISGIGSGRGGSGKGFIGGGTIEAVNVWFVGSIGRFGVLP